MKKINQLLDTVTRVSMLQTAMNCASNNFQGKGVPSVKITGYASQLYASMMKQVVATESGNVITPASKTVRAGVTPIRVNRKSTAQLLARVRASQRKGKK